MLSRWWWCTACAPGRCSAAEDLTVRIGTRPIAGDLRKPWTYEAMIATVDAAVRGAAP
jgi:hypothetical protein